MVGGKGLDQVVLGVANTRWAFYSMEEALLTQDVNAPTGTVLRPRPSQKFYMGTTPGFFKTVQASKFLRAEHNSARREERIIKIVLGNEYNGQKGFMR